MRRGIAAALVLVVVFTMAAFALGGCGQVSTQEAETRLRNDLDDFKLALEGMLDPNIYTNKDLFNGAWNKVEDSFNSVVDSARQVKNARVSNFTAAFNDLKKAAGNITSEQSLQQKAADISSALTEVNAAWQELISGFGSGQ